MDSPKDPFAQNPFAAWLPPFLNPANLNPFAGVPGMMAGGAPDASAWVKAIDPTEIEKRIQELRVVEMWLQSQVNLVQMSVQALTLQKQSMEALKAAAKGVSEQAMASTAGASPTPRAKKTARKR